MWHFFRRQTDRHGSSRTADRQQTEARECARHVLHAVVRFLVLLDRIWSFGCSGLAIAPGHCFGFLHSSARLVDIKSLVTLAEPSFLFVEPSFFWLAEPSFFCWWNPHFFCCRVEFVLLLCVFCSCGRWRFSHKIRSWARRSISKISKAEVDIQSLVKFDCSSRVDWLFS